jgi:hypothetical protein
MDPVREEREALFLISKYLRSLGAKFKGTIDTFQEELVS